MACSAYAVQGARGFAATNSAAQDVENVEAIQRAAAGADGASGRKLVVELFSLVAGLGVGLLDTWRGVNGGGGGIILRGGA